MKRTKKNKLSTKLMVGVLLFALFILICTSAAVGIYSSNVEIKELTANAFAISNISN